MDESDSEVNNNKLFKGWNCLLVGNITVPHFNNNNCNPFGM